MLNSLLFPLKKFLYPVFASVLVIFLFGRESAELKIHQSENYPRWLMNNGYQTSQTSGITFLRQIEDGSLEFLLADDVGKIHRLSIKDDTLFNFSEIKFSDDVISYLSGFPKPDFEEIFYDKYTEEVYLTIEGNGQYHLQYHGIYRLKFFDDDIFCDSVVAFEKLLFKPQEAFNSFLTPNVGYEAFTADENFFYLGLENVLTSQGEFSDHTLIRVADKKSLTIIKEISTENLDISTICGLYSDKNFSIWGVDRNHRKVFKLLFDEYFKVVDLSIFEIKTVIPGYNHFDYIGSLESITVASEKFLFLVDDPWHTYFIPPNDILEKLDSSTAVNFRNFIPVIYKFDIY
jgi:hypothetical protein